MSTAELATSLVMLAVRAGVAAIDAAREHATAEESEAIERELAALTSRHARSLDAAVTAAAAEAHAEIERRRRPTATPIGDE